MLTINDRDGGEISVPQLPNLFSNARSGVKGPAPDVGELNHTVLDECLALSKDDVEAIIESDLLAASTDWNQNRYGNHP